MANTETMTITAALVELKTLGARIEKAIDNANFVGVYMPNVSNGTSEEMETKCKSDYQSVLNLMKRRDAIKRAIVASNATTTVKVPDLSPKADGTDYTVAEIIELRANGTKYMKILADVMRRRAAAAKKNFEDQRTRVEHVAQDIQKSILGAGTPDESTNSRATEAYQVYIQQNSPKLVDPEDIITQITQLEKDIEVLGSATDVALSISNANTSITVTY